MEERRNNRRVENRLKDALRHDRARIQVGRISHFGLLEMSRQRLRTGVMEGSTTQCPHCQGTGIVRSTESVALAVLRALEDHLVRDSRASLTGVTTAEVALYILNNKRSFVTEMEHRYGVSIAVLASERMHGANFAIERSAAPVVPRVERSTAVNMEWAFDGDDAEEAVEPAHVGEEAEVEAHAEGEADERRPRRRRRRSRRDDRDRGRGEPERLAAEGDGQHDHDAEGVQPPVGDDEYDSSEPAADTHGEIPGLGEQPSPSLSDDEQGEERRGRRRRRGRRGGRRGRDREGLQEDADAAAGAEAGADESAPEAEAEAQTLPAPLAESPPDDQPTDQQRHADDHAAEPSDKRVDELIAEPHAGDEPVEERAVEPPPRRPERRRQPAHAAASVETSAPPDVRQPVAEKESPAPTVESPVPSAPAVDEAPEHRPSAHAETAEANPPAVAPVDSDPLKPARKGWWQRRVTVD
ncbi:MAG TPA: ribonuclease E/G, partial [Hyphomicrobiaceae bacterium]|nr:ribonuclease E/G [Hyphomicrobiaceae bacterium]